MFGNGNKNFNFPRASRARLLVINENATEIGDGTTSAPTDEEAAWLAIMNSKDPERDKLRKRISVCALAEVVDYNPEQVTIAYDGKKYTIKKPANGLRIARAREVSAMDALEELNAQRRIVQGEVPLDKDFSGIDAELIIILSNVADRFFFTPYL